MARCRKVRDNFGSGRETSTTISTDDAPSSPPPRGEVEKAKLFRVGGMRKRLKRGTIKRARQLRDTRSDTERLLWWKLRELNTQGFHFRRQVPLRGYFLDFAEHSGRLAIELDGSQHGFRQNAAYDVQRDLTIADEGHVVLRFWNAEIWENLDGVVETILRELGRRRPPHPDRFALRPPHKGEVIVRTNAPRSSRGRNRTPDSP